MGGSAANRITATLNFDGTALGNSGGSQSHTLTLGETPANINVQGSVTLAIPNNVLSTGASANGLTNVNVTAGATTAPLNATGSASLTSTNTGGNAHTILSPAIITTKIIYAGV
jgi:microcystin-dependent protein